MADDVLPWVELNDLANICHLPPTESPIQGLNVLISIITVFLRTLLTVLYIFCLIMHPL